jgi:ATP-dependent DNA helicase RecG
MNDTPDVQGADTDAPPGFFQLHFRENPSLDLTDLHGVGPATADKLADRDIEHAGDLLLFVPRKYRRVARHLPGDEVADQQYSHVELTGRIRDVSRPPSHSRAPLEVHVAVDNQRFNLLWFNMQHASFTRLFQPGVWITFEGDVDWSNSPPSLAHPTFDISDDKPTPQHATIDLEPVYPSLEDINDSRLRGAIEDAADKLLSRAVDVVPAELLDARELPTVRTALQTIHLLTSVDADRFPDALRRARARLVYEEFFTLQRALAEEYAAERRAARAPNCTQREMGRQLVRQLPFELTGDQREASRQIAQDLSGPRPMRRLLQGDVGAGKTVVAMLAAAICIDSGQQAALMAPTDILAQQHLRTARDLFADQPVDIAPLTGGLAADEHRRHHRRIADGDVDLAIGTHALFQDDISFDALGLAIVDEQHKFGVDQRAALLDKGTDPHLLAMTATPIPRSLAHTAFGDLDLTLIREKPPGRKPVRTFLRPRSRADRVYEYVSQRVANSDEQAYFVYPMVEPSEAVPNRKSAVSAAERLANGPLSNCRVGILHGQMDDDTKHRTMQTFADGDIDVLCATTVVEVGMDVPTATIMVIESPEVFGLSQLHQLRGRVGRSEADSICVLLAGYGLTPEARERLESFQATDDGFDLAEKDLEIRGPGEFLGERQSGRAEFRFGEILRDRELLETARRDARRITFGDAGG